MEEKRSTNWTPLIVNIVLLVIGIIMICAPDFALDIIIIVPAIAVLVYGIVSVIYYAVKRKTNNLKGSYLVWPVIAIAAGILLIIFKDEVQFVLPVLFGAWLIISGIKVLFSNKGRAASGGKRFLTVLGIIMLVIGIVLVILGLSGLVFQIVIAIGILLLVYGVVSIISVLVQSKLNKAAQKRVK